MGAAGAAIATSISRTVHAVLLLIYVLKSKKLMFRLEKVLKYKPNSFLIKRILAIGVPNGFENSMFQIGRVILTSLVSGFGTASIAANAVANTLTSFQYAQGNAISSGLTTIVGRCIGAGEQEQAKQNTKKLVWYAYVGMFIVSAILCAFAGFFVGLYNLSAESAKMCKILIYVHSIIVCLIWPIAFVLPNAFRSASDVKFTTIISMIAMWAFRVALSYVFAYVFHFEVYSVWIAMFCDWVFRIIFFIPRFTSGKWLHAYKS
jgi:Na+-driven multidrug efflux pump